MSAHVPHAPLIRWSVPPPRRVQSGTTALMSAAWEEKWNVVKLLITRKADPNFKNKVRFIIGSAFPNALPNVVCLTHMVAIHTVICQRGGTALMRAGENGRSDIVKLLLARGAKINAQDNVRSTCNDESMG